MVLRHLSLFAGIGGFDLGFERAGMVSVGQVENDAKCVSVLERWWPDVPRWGDVRTFRPGRDTADVVSGGFPCQDVSVAGKRAGLAGERSGLWSEFHRILAECRPAWVVVENVPGLLSSNGGRDFATILSGLGELGYGLGWRVLDAQYFGVAQRRRRVFIVGHLGDRRPSVRVLDLAQGCCGDTPPSRTAGPAVAALTSCGLGGGGPDDNLAQAGHVIPFQLRGRDGGAMAEVEPDGFAGALRAGDGGSSRGRMVAFAHNQRDEVREIGDLSVAVSSAQSGTHQQETLLALDDVRELADKGKNGPCYREGVAFTLDTVSHPGVLAQGVDLFNQTLTGDQHVPLRTAQGHGAPAVMTTGVRRLTPVECARLQGFPDNWNDHLADSHRYRQYGNAVCVNVAEWLMRRLAAVGEG